MRRTDRDEDGARNHCVSTYRVHTEDDECESDERKKEPIDEPSRRLPPARVTQTIPLNTSAETRNAKHQSL